MNDVLLTEKRKNKNFVIQNRSLLNQYAVANFRKFGRGAIVINLVLLDKDILTPEDLQENQASEAEDITLQQSFCYIPIDNFWFKMLYLKIKNKHQIDLKEQYNFDEQFLVIFIKNTSMDNFSIYTLKSNKKSNS
jgi:hypothetical protein